MTTDLLDRVPLNEITEQARQVRFGRSVATVIAAILFGIGWAVARLFGVAWFALVWSAVAVREGFRSGRGVQAGPSQVR